MYHGGLLRLVHFDPAIVFVYHGFLKPSLICRASLALMFSNWRHPRFRYFGFVVPVYVVWVIGLGYLLPLSLSLCTNGCFGQ